MFRDLAHQNCIWNNDWSSLAVYLSLKMEISLIKLMSDKVDIFYSCVAVFNPKGKESVNGVSIVYEYHKDNQNP